MQQLRLDIPLEQYRTPPTTRYQGSKYKLLNWIRSCVEKYEFEIVLDAFGGTGSVSYLFKQMNKAVYYNDYLQFNYWIGKAIIENSASILDDKSIEDILNVNPDTESVVAKNFSNIYFTDAENRWLDGIISNISQIDHEYKKSLAYYALFQACIIKRPYNLFHRKNLYIRTADVERSFGNKATWDKPFSVHFRDFITIANESVFDNGTDCYAMCHNIFDVSGAYDMVYFDPPYINAKGVGVDYADFYHFLEGIVQYDQWQSMIDFSRKHHPLYRKYTIWHDPKRITQAFDQVFDMFNQSILVVSYRSDGIPSPEELIKIIQRHKPYLEIHTYGAYQYTLSTNQTSKEILLIGY